MILADENISQEIIVAIETSELKCIQFINQIEEFQMKK